MYGWNPLASAAGGAAFAGVLAALVIAVSIQIALQSGRSADDSQLSLKAAAPTLVALMVAAYLYIVLDGVPSTAVEVSDALGPKEALIPGRLEEVAHGYAQLAARSFALAGSVLAIGALMTIFIVAASILDNTPVSPNPNDARGWAVAVVRAGVMVIIGILLLGYNVGAQIEGTSTGLWWWVLTLGLLGLPVLAGWLASRNRPQTLFKPSWPWLRMVILTGLVVLPTFAVLGLVALGPDHVPAPGFTWFSSAGALYYAFSATVLLVATEHHYIRTQFTEDDAERPLVSAEEPKTLS